MRKGGSSLGGSENNRQKNPTSYDFGMARRILKMHIFFLMCAMQHIHDECVVDIIVADAKPRDIDTDEPNF